MATYESSLPKRRPPRGHEGERGRRGPHRRHRNRGAELLLQERRRGHRGRGHLEVAHRPHAADEVGDDSSLLLQDFFSYLNL